MKGQVLQIVLTITVGYIICVDAQSKIHPMKKPIDLSTDESQSYTNTTDDESEMIIESSTDIGGPPNQDIDQDLYSHNGTVVEGHNTTDAKQMFNESSTDIKRPQVLPNQDIAKELPSEYKQQSNPSNKKIGFKTGFKATGGCERGTRVGTQCLSFSEASLNWESAAIVCIAFGGRLVVLDNIPEAFEILAYAVRNYDGIEFWIGGSDLDTEGTWKWHGTDEEFDDTFPWGCEQPNNIDGNQHCLYLGGEREYGDGFCTDKKRFICEFGIYN